MKRISNFKILTFLFIIVIISNFCSAAHYIVGYVENAKDGTEANGHTVMLWNPEVGMNENLTDIIGPIGNSGTNNMYMLDCELLPSGCNITNILSVNVINNGDDYISYEKNITVGGYGYDIVENITLNSPPLTNLIFPQENENLSTSYIEFNCSLEDSDENYKEISLYGNWTGEWELNETKEISAGEKFKIFIKTLSQGFYKYACKITDDLFISTFSIQNNSFTVDFTNPLIESIIVNESSFCGKENIIRVNCTAYDEFIGIDQIIIQAISPTDITNYSALTLYGNTYYYDILLDKVGDWQFQCIVNDSAGNVDSLFSEEIQVYSNLPELGIYSSTINLSNLNPIENEEIYIKAIIENTGCSDAQQVSITFFNGDPDYSGENIGESILNISNHSNIEANITWNAEIGLNEIFVLADFTNIFIEDNEENNKASKNFSINAWQEIYGNTSIDKIIGDDLRIKKWFNESNLEGNIFVTDSESNINWLSLMAIGKNNEGQDSSNDFYEIDQILGMASFDDSVSEVFSNNQEPKEKINLLIYQKEVEEIPVINSTENSKFITGILWDSSDDSLDGEFDSLDKEDLIFVSPIKKSSQGAYGIYDYEIKIPSKLREYNNLDSEEVYLYYDLN